MAITKIRNSTWLDEIGLKLGMPRFRNESISHYRTRLLHFVYGLPEPTQRSYISTLSGQLGELNKEIFKIEPITTYDSNLDATILLATDPYISVDSAFLRIWEDYSGNPENPDIELDIYNRTGAYFLRDVYDEISTLPFLNITTIGNDSDWEYLRSANLAYGGNHRYASSIPLGFNKMNDIPYRYLREVLFENDLVFKNEVSAPNYMAGDNGIIGDYYIDRYNGIIFSFAEARGMCYVSYSEFPYSLYWQPIRAYPMNDDSIDYILKDVLLGTEGEEERLLLNPIGARMLNDILKTHPLQWGK